MDNEEEVKKRRFFRLDDQIIFEFKILSSEQDNHEFNSADYLAKTTDVIKEIKRINFQDGSPRVIQQLKQVETQLNTIVTLLGDNLPKTWANISAGGLAFYHHEPIAADTILKLKLVLPTNYDCIITKGKVTACVQKTETTDEKTITLYRVALSFIDLKPPDEEKIVCHMNKRQIQQRLQDKG